MAGALAGEVAIVTGAGVNTGAVIARTLAREGAAVVVNYRNAAEGARATVEAIEKDSGKALAVQGDVTRPDDVKQLVGRTVEAFGSVSILVNNANVRSYRPLMEIPSRNGATPWVLRSTAVSSASRPVCRICASLGAAPS
jgi:3-oxoacyl-[acyl-carrier protein] reductase